MSFSSDVKENLSKISNYNKDILIAEFIGYLLCGNTTQNEKNIEFITENEFNIEHLYKILFNLNIEYEPEIRGKFFVAQISIDEADKYLKNYKNMTSENEKKNFAKGVFLGAGCVNNPEKNYHLEIIFNKNEYFEYFAKICLEFGINFKEIAVNEKFQAYLKDAEEISNFLAFIGANKAVLDFEDVRVMKEMKNNVNRRVNCETANLNKTIEAALKQIDDINYLKKMKKFDDLPQDLKQIAKLRLENPDLSLNDLSKLAEPAIGKSAVNRKFKKIHEIVEELK